MSESAVPWHGRSPPRCGCSSSAGRRWARRKPCARRRRTWRRTPRRWWWWSRPWPGSPTSSWRGRGRPATRTRTAWPQVIREFRDRHLGLVRQTLVVPKSLEALSEEVERSTAELVAMCDGVRILRELTPRAEDAVVARGERLLARLFVALLGERRRRAAYVDATEVIFTERRFGSLWPDFARCEKAAARKVKPSLRAGVGGGAARLPGHRAGRRAGHARAAAAPTSRPRSSPARCTRAASRCGRRSTGS